MMENILAALSLFAVSAAVWGFVHPTLQSMGQAYHAARMNGARHCAAARAALQKL